MTTDTKAWTEEMIEVAGTKLQLIKGGTGDPLLILHGEMGHPGWLRFHDGLSQGNTLHIPSHPGFGKTERLDWIMNMRDMAGWYLEAIDDLGLGQVNLMGFSLGGWLALSFWCSHLYWLAPSLWCSLNLWLAHSSWCSLVR